MKVTSNSTQCEKAQKNKKVVSKKNREKTHTCINPY